MFRLRSCTVRQRFDRCLQGVARVGLCGTLLLAASACLFACPKTDDEVRRVAGLNGIPEADAEFLIARIAEVEKSAAGDRVVRRHVQVATRSIAGIR